MGNVDRADRNEKRGREKERKKIAQNIYIIYGYTQPKGEAIKLVDCM
jgi:hypothetical protein